MQHTLATFHSRKVFSFFFNHWGILNFKKKVAAFFHAASHNNLKKRIFTLYIIGMLTALDADEYSNSSRAHLAQGVDQVHRVLDLPEKKITPISK